MKTFFYWHAQVIMHIMDACPSQHNILYYTTIVKKKTYQPLNRQTYTRARQKNVQMPGSCNPEPLVRTALDDEGDLLAK